MFHVKWHGDEFEDKFEKDVQRNLKKAAITASSDIKKELSKAQSPPTSKPNTPPNIETGELRRSIAWEVDKHKQVARVGTNKVYGRYLEFGTSIMEKRSFLRHTLNKNWRKYQRIIKGK